MFIPEKTFLKMKTREALVRLGEWINTKDPLLEKIKGEASVKNPWFTETNLDHMLSAVSKDFLDGEKLDDWLKKYSGSENCPSKVVALILAGNIPLVGFHDVLCVMISGHKALVKLSEKDDVLLPGLIGKMGEWYPAVLDQIKFVERLVGFDAVIATGSNQSARNFQKYFAKYPHIIRKNRSSVAILTGRETKGELLNLGRDIFSYFGLGCRNVSKIYVPQAYDFVPLLTTLNYFNEVVNHSKYKNNYDYHLATAIINQQEYMSNDCLILLEEKSVASKVAVLHYEHYDDAQELMTELMNKDEIQCVVSQIESANHSIVGFGKAQHPSLDDYADGIDTISFLQSLPTN